MVSIILLTLRHQRLSLIAPCSTDMPRVCDCFNAHLALADISAAFSKDSLFNAYKQVRCRTTSSGTQNAPVDSTHERGNSGLLITLSR
jgi:hypothetical protein